MGSKVEGDSSWRSARVHEHGFVHLVDSMPHWDNARHGQLGPGDIRIVQAARVSMNRIPAKFLREVDADATDDDDRSVQQDVKLIEYLYKNKHTSPFEKVRIEAVVRAPIFVARQWFRHRMGSYNEQSARYSQLAPVFYVPSTQRMASQHSTNKQASGEQLPRELAVRNVERIRAANAAAYKTYQDMLEDGVARELARTVLPVSIYTTWYWTVDLKNLIDFLRLRLDDHAQSEIAAYGQALLPMVEKIAPVTMGLFKAQGRPA